MKWPGRAALIVVAVVVATAVLAIPSGPAGADSLCLDQANNFVPCPAPTAPAPVSTTGIFPNQTRRFFGTRGIFPAQRPAPAHSGRTRTLLILGLVAMAACAIALAVRRMIVDRSHRSNRAADEDLATEPMPSIPETAAGSNGASTPTGKPSHASDLGTGPDGPPTPSWRPSLAPEMAWSGASRSPDGSRSTPDIQRSLSHPSLIAEGAVVYHTARAGDVTIDQLVTSNGPVRLHQVTVDSLVQLSAKLDKVQAADSDLVLALPAQAVVLGRPEELVKAAQLIGGICVGASATPLAAPALAERLKRAIADGVGNPVLRCHCFPHALFGPAAQLRSLLADLPAGGSDADRLTKAVLAGRQDLIVDVVSFFFHVLDGTGTDVTLVAGRAHVGGKQPLVLIDPTPGGQALASAEAALADPGAGDLARLLRYDGAASAGDEVTVAANEVMVTRLWSPSFCATVIRAAEVAGLWTDDGSTAQVGVSLPDLIPRLSSHLEADLARRVWPRLGEWRPFEAMTMTAATVTRRKTGAQPASPAAPSHEAEVMGSVRLNDGYTGGALLLPRQGWDDSVAPVGALALWPSAASHPHEVTPLTRGVRYALHLSLRKTGP